MKNRNGNKAIKNSCHAKLDLASSTHAVMKQQTLKILNQFNQTPYYNLTGRGPVVKAAVQVAPHLTPRA